MKAGFRMILTCATALSCGGPGGSPQQEDQASAGGPGNIDPAMSEWIAYLESSDDGLGEDFGSRTPVYAFTGFLTDPEALDPLVYNPYDICTSGDTVFVTDLMTKQIVALDPDGNLLWKAGREGEGPGEFPMVSTIAVSPRYVAASNYHVSRIEFFNRDGSFSHSLGFSGAQGMAALDDSTFIVTSTTESGGDIHLVSPENGVLESFGEVETIDYGDVQRMDLIRICTNGDGRLALFNRYEGLLAVYDLGTEECVYRGSRTYPATPSPPQGRTDSDGNTHWLFLPIGGDAFMGHDGMLNVIITGFMEDGSFLSDPEKVDFAPFTSIDRYDWDGNYLDSWCLPDSCISHVSVLPGDRFVATDFSEGVLRMYDRQ
jgi:hypothetical protein